MIELFDFAFAFVVLSLMLALVLAFSWHVYRVQTEELRAQALTERALQRQNAALSNRIEALVPDRDSWRDVAQRALMVATANSNAQAYDRGIKDGWRLAEASPAMGLYPPGRPRPPASPGQPTGTA